MNSQIRLMVVISIINSKVRGKGAEKNNPSYQWHIKMGKESNKIQRVTRLVEIKIENKRMSYESCDLHTEEILSTRSQASQLPVTTV